MTLAVADLTVSAGPKTLVAGLSFDIAAGERVGLIGESGSGKSLTASAIMGLLPEELTAAGSVRLGGRELIGAPERELSRLRGRELSMVFQEPMTALNPTMRVGRQVAESMLLHRTRRDRRSAHAAAVELLDAVRLPDPARAAHAYPHQLSGGQRQRVLLAIALANDPALLICDEPTTALDVTVQAQILELILAGVTRPERACERTNVTGRPRAAAPSLRGAVTSALLFITHDLAVVASVAQRVLVLYQGKIVEAGPTVDVLTTPRHDYTRRLLAASELEPRR